MSAAMVRKTDLPFGAQLLGDGSTRFRLWAPAARSVALVLYGSAASGGDGTSGTAEFPAPADSAESADSSGSRTQPMAPSTVPLPGTETAITLYEWHCKQPLAGHRYQFLIDGEHHVPDPASRFNPEDADGSSIVIDPGSYSWEATEWKGRPWHEFVLYELHVGTFTEEGTFEAAGRRLDHLVALGVTAIEIMPVADFPGRRNWGYDGVLLFAPDAAYGTPDDFKRFIDQAHQHGIAVILDVVYNHFGPKGNLLGSYAPSFFTDRHITPWGDAINFDGDDSAAVRAFYRYNALYWIDEFFLDGLRLDAVHAIKDESPYHFLDELSLAVSLKTDRHVHLILENENNQATLLERLPDASPAVATAQWNDDIHHALHSLLTGEEDGYYADFSSTAVQQLADGLAQGFIYQGQASPHAGGSARGEPSGSLPTLAFINFLQNHDQIGNRAFGDRIGQLAPAAAVRAAAACVLLGPAVPMIFMGEEFAASSPFLYFCDFDGDLATAVRDGRRREFARFSQFTDPAARQQIPDPTDKATFHRSKLDWSEAQDGEHAAMLGFYQECLQIRRRIVQPLLVAGGQCTAVVTILAERAFVVRWTFDRLGTLSLAANFSPVDRVDVAIETSPGGARMPLGKSAFEVNRIAKPSPAAVTLGPWGVALFAS